MDATLLIDHAPTSPTGGAGVVQTRLLLTLTGHAPSSETRPPIAVALVLDRSGSMEGEPLAAATAAAAWAVARLHPKDVVSAIAFDNHVDVLADPACVVAHPGLGARLLALRTGGSTNLSGGWLRGRHHMEQAHALLQEMAGSTRRIVVLTDGHANEGITDHEQLTALARRAREQGISTTTIGVGSGYDDTLLRAMADAGGGNAWYVERPDQSHDVFAEELGNLLSVAAQGVSVTLTMAPVVRAHAVHSNWQAQTAHEGSIVFDLGDLYASEPKPLLLELHTDLAALPTGAATEIARLTVRADVIGADGTVEHRVLHLPIAASADTQHTLHPEIERAVLLAAAAHAREEAATLQRVGEGAQAAETMRRASERLRERLAQLPEALRPDVQEQARDLSALGEQYAAGAFSEQDAKYQMQRSYNTRRGKQGYDAVLSRVDPPER